MIEYTLTSEGRVLVRFEPRWWKETLNETDRLVMLSLYMHGGSMTSKAIAEDVNLPVLEVEGSLRDLIGYRYAEREFV